MPQHHLPIDLERFPFVTRETRHGKTAPFRCFRDFLFYTLAYYKPETYTGRHPQEFESNIFGKPVPKTLIWTMLHMKRLLQELAEQRLLLYVNNCPIHGYWTLLRALALPKKPAMAEITATIEKNVARGTVFGLDLAVSWFGLVDHLLFVYGYDDKNVYVIDTHQVSGVSYTKLTDDDRFLMKLPWSEIEAKIGYFSRTWGDCTM